MTGKGAFDRYLAEIREHPLLDRAEEVELAHRIAQGDQAALDRLVGCNLRFVVSVARRYANRGVPLDELVTEGNLGLVRAARRFDPSREVRFVSYAVWWIRQAVLSALTRDGRIVKIPAGRVDESRRVAATRRRLSQERGRPVRAGEVAIELGMDESRVREALELRRRDVSLDAPLPHLGRGSLLERVTASGSDDPEGRLERAALAATLRDGLLLLPEREAEVIRRYYGLDGREPMTLSGIGESLGVSRERVAVLRDRALRRLRAGPVGRNLGTFRTG